MRETRIVQMIGWFNSNFSFMDRNRLITLDRNWVFQLFHISGSAWRSLIFVCLNFPKNKTGQFGLWFHSPNGSKWPDYRMGENWRFVGLQLATLSLSPNFLLLLAHKWSHSWRPSRRLKKGGLCPPKPPCLAGSFLPQSSLRSHTYGSAGGTPLHPP